MKGRPPPTLAEATPYIYSITIIYVNYNKIIQEVVSIDCDTFLITQK